MSGSASRTAVDQTSGPSWNRPHVYLLAGADRRIAAGHPWAFANEIRLDEAAKALAPGTIASLHRVDGKPLAAVMVNPHALITARVIDWDAKATIDTGFFVDRLARARRLREHFFLSPFYRLVHAEGDGLPGLVVDRFDDVIVVQANTAGMDALAAPLLDAIDAVLADPVVVFRNDSRARALEGLSLSVHVARGTLPPSVHVQEGDLSFAVDVLGGQKTGWFFDQRENRAFCAPLAGGGRVLDVYCHSGAFAIRALAAGAGEALLVDSSESALALARVSAEANGVAGRCEIRKGDAFAELERLVREKQRFRLVIADPPAFAKSRKEVGVALRGYRKLARLAAALVEPEGFLFIASCSHTVEQGAFHAEVAAGLERAGRRGRIVRAAGAGPDHPVHHRLPETAYLKALAIQLD